MSYTHYIDLYFNRLAEFLVGLGIAPDQGRFAAMIATYLELTLLVILLVFLLLRGRRGKKAEPTVEEERPSSEGTPPAGAEIDEQFAETAETVVAEPRPETEVATPLTREAIEGEAEAVKSITPPKEAVEAGLFLRLRQGLSKTRSSLLGRFETLLDGHPRLDDEFIEELEEILITADFGMQATQELVQALTTRLKEIGTAGQEQLYGLLREEIRNRLQSSVGGWPKTAGGPLVIMVVGVNGVGKTTTIGKLAKQFTDQGKKVVLGAGDTFRAAAAQQLQVWGERSGADVVCHAEGSDPAAVAFDAAKAAIARKADVLILDTAGRLHTKVNLMEELKKVRRVIAREISGAPHETLLVLDATTGQNALIQAKMFQDVVEVSGIALTKLDGTAKGGIVVAIGTQLGLPVRLIGVGEGVADLRPFAADEFVEALFSNA